MPSGDASLSLPRTAVAVSLRLADGEAFTGDVFVMDRVAYRDGPETVLEMLNRAEDFFPFRVRSGKNKNKKKKGITEPQVLLVARSHTVAVTLDTASLLGDPERRAAAHAVTLNVHLTTGNPVTGEARFEAPAMRQRPLDYLNASRDPFFALAAGDTTWYINRVHVRYVRPGD